MGSTIVNNGTITMNGDYLADVRMDAGTTSSLMGDGTWINGGFGVYGGTCRLADEITLPDLEINLLGIRNVAVE